MVRVHLYAALRQITGRREVTVPAEKGETVRAVLERLLARYPKLRTYLLDEAGQLQRHLHVFFNGQVIYDPDDVYTTVQNGDELAIFPRVAGDA